MKAMGRPKKMQRGDNEKQKQATAYDSHTNTRLVLKAAIFSAPR
jgi:hypothetical protein